MNNIVLKTLTEKCGVKDGDRIIVAISGGADSTALLRILLELRKKFSSLEIMAAHINHKLRGAESDRDEAFVTSLCNENNVKLFVRREDVAALAKSTKQSIELCAREVRYAFFRELSEKYGAKIATAHTLSDCEETMLFNIARGTSLKGLCSIPYKRDEIIRPLLDVTREQVEEYCRCISQNYVQDSTNLMEDICQRNRIRHSVLPPLKSLNSGFDVNFSKLKESLLEIYDLLERSVNRAINETRCDFGYDAAKLREYPRAVINGVLAKIIKDAGATPENRHIAICRDILITSGAVMLPGGYTAVCAQGVFRVTENEHQSNGWELPLEREMIFSFGGNEYIAQVLSKKEIVNRNLADCCIDCDKIVGAVIRTRREGDTFPLMRRGITKPLRKLQNELKIPAELRDTTLVIAQGSMVLWAEHIGVSAKGALSAEYAEGFYITKKDVGNNA